MLPPTNSTASGQNGSVVGAFLVPEAVAGFVDEDVFEIGFADGDGLKSIGTCFSRISLSQLGKEVKRLKRVDELAQAAAGQRLK